MSRGDAGYDRYLTIFSPEGRLYQIEYAMKAVKSSGLTSVGMRGKNCVAIVTQKKVPDKMIDPSSVSHMYTITPHIGCVMTGLPADAAHLVARTRQEAAQFKYNNGYSIPSAFLATRAADIAQVNTQHAGRRTMGADMILCSVDDEAGPQLHHIDPAGQFFGYKAVAAGAKAQEANSLLERRVNENEEPSLDETIQGAIMTLQTTVSADFKPTEIEVGLVVGGEAFRLLDESEIDDHLTAIAERD